MPVQPSDSQKQPKDGLKLDVSFSSTVVDLSLIVQQAMKSGALEAARSPLSEWLQDHPDARQVLVTGVTRALADPAYFRLLKAQLMRFPWLQSRYDEFLQRGPNALDDSELAQLVLSPEQMHGLQARIRDDFTRFWVEAVDDAMEAAAQATGKSRLSISNLAEQVRSLVQKKNSTRLHRAASTRPATVNSAVAMQRRANRSSAPENSSLDTFIAARLGQLEDKLENENDVYKRLGVILHECQNVVHGYAGEISIILPPGQAQANDWLRVVARSGPAAEGLPYLVPARIGITGRVMRTGQTAEVPRTLEDDDFRAAMSDCNPIAEIYHEEHWREYQESLKGLRSALKIPLWKQHEVVGVLGIHCPEAREFGRPHVDLAQALARRAAIEVSNLLDMEEPRLPWDPGVSREASMAQLATTAEIAKSSASASVAFDKQQAVLLSDPDYIEAVSHGPREKLRAVATRLADTACVATGAYRAAVRFIDPCQESLVVIGHAGEDGSWPSDFLTAPVRLSEDTAAGHAIRTRESYYLEDTAQKWMLEGEKRVPTHYRPVTPTARAHASILLQHEGHILGVLSVDWKLAGACDGRMRKLLEGLVERFGFALKAFSIDALFLSLDGLLSRASYANTEPDYEEFLRIVAKMVGARQGAIFLREADTGFYHAVASLVHTNWSRDTHFYRPGQGVTGFVIKHNCSVRVADLRDQKELLDVFPSDPPIWEDHLCDGKDDNDRNFSYLGVPIAVGDHVYAVIRVADTKCGFTSYDQKCVEAAAARLATLLEKYDRRKKAEQLTVLASAIAAAKSRSILAKRVFAVLKDVLGDCTCWIRLVEGRQGDGPAALMRFAVSDPSWASRTPRVRRLGQGIAGRCASERRTMLFDFPTLEAAVADPSVPRIVGEDPANGELFQEFRSIACVPLCAESAVVGTLLICRKNHLSLTAGDVSFVQEVADLVGPAFVMARSTEGSKMTVRLLKATNTFLLESLSRGKSSQGEQQLLVEVCCAIRNGLGGHGVAAWVYEPQENAFRCHFSEGLKDLPIPNLDWSWVFWQLKGSPLIVLEPEEDRRLVEFFGPGRTTLGEIVRGCQGTIIPIATADGQLDALFLVVADLGSQVSHDRVQEAEALLRGLPISLVRRGLYSDSLTPSRFAVPR